MSTCPHEPFSDSGVWSRTGPGPGPTPEASTGRGADGQGARANRTVCEGGQKNTEGKQPWRFPQGSTKAISVANLILAPIFCMHFISRRASDSVIGAWPDNGHTTFVCRRRRFSRVMHQQTQTKVKFLKEYYNNQAVLAVDMSNTCD